MFLFNGIHFGHILPFISLLPDSAPFPTNPSLCLFLYCYYSLKHSWCCPCTIGLYCLSLEWAFFTRSHTFRKTRSLSPSNNQLQQIQNKGWQCPCSHPSWDLVCFEHGQVLCFLSQLLWIHLWNCSIVSRKQFFL